MKIEKFSIQIYVHEHDSEITLQINWFLTTIFVALFFSLCFPFIAMIHFRLMNEKHSFTGRRTFLIVFLF